MSAPAAANGQSTHALRHRFHRIKTVDRRRAAEAFLVQRDIFANAAMDLGFTAARRLASYFRNLECRGMEQLFGFDSAVGQALLMEILRQRVDLAAILGHAVFPEI